MCANADDSSGVWVSLQARCALWIFATVKGSVLDVVVSCMDKLRDALSAYVVHLLHARGVAVADALSQLAQRMVASNRRSIKVGVTPSESTYRSC